MASVQIIVGTVMGTALNVALTIKSALENFGHGVQVTEHFRVGDLAMNDSIILVCTSNTGMGDIPANLTGFYAHIVNERPEMTGRAYNVVNLGDSSYPNFGEAGKLIDTSLKELGGHRLGDMFIMDAILVDDYEEEAEHWAAQWNKLI